ncbi:MAG TPA: hypothetical protein VF607_03855, partial [Verrucomicrobiae bacterium]
MKRVLSATAGHRTERIRKLGGGLKIKVEVVGGVSWQVASGRFFFALALGRLGRGWLKVALNREKVFENVAVSGQNLHSPQKSAGREGFPT